MRNLFKLCLIVVCGFLVVTICSCQFFIPEETVEVELPEWPEYLPELEKWCVNLSVAAEPVEVSSVPLVPSTSDDDGKDEDSEINSEDRGEHFFLL